MIKSCYSGETDVHQYNNTICRKIYVLGDMIAYLFIIIQNDNQSRDMGNAEVLIFLIFSSIVLENTLVYGIISLKTIIKLMQ